MRFASLSVSAPHLLVDRRSSFFSPRVLLASALMGLLGALLVAAPAAASCNPKVMQYAQQRQQQDVQAAYDHAAQVYQASKNQPTWINNSDGMLTACSANNWPRVSISNPILSQLMNGAEQQAVKLACNEARQAVAQGSNAIQGVLNNVPGYATLNSIYQSGNNVSGIANNAGAGLANWAVNGSNPLNGLPDVPSVGAGGGYQPQSWTGLPGVGQPPVFQNPTPVSGPASGRNPHLPPPTLPGVSVQ